LTDEEGKVLLDTVLAVFEKRGYKPDQAIPVLLSALGGCLHAYARVDLGRADAMAAISMAFISQAISDAQPRGDKCALH